MTNRLISPSKITAWLACAHTLTLEKASTTGGSAGSEMAQMLMAKGQQHELDVLKRYEDDGKSVLKVPERITPDNPNPDGAGGASSQDFPGGWEPFEDWVARVGNPMAGGEHDVIFQMPLVHEGIRGIADFLVRVDAPTDGDPGPAVYEAVDAKLARTEAKPGHVLQLCFYADAVRELTGQRADTVAIQLGSGKPERIRLDAVDPYWQRVRARLFDALKADPADETSPVPCSHCDFCDYQQVCKDQWKDEQSLVLVAGLRSTDRAKLATNGVETVPALASLDQASAANIDVVELDRHIRQADLQQRTSALANGSAPLFELIEHAPLPQSDDGLAAPSVGFAAMPAPSPGDVFLDFEGHPFWTAEQGLFFLFGLIEQEEAASSSESDSDNWTFVEFWAHDPDQEVVATRNLIDHLAERRERFPDMHVYHYNHTERSALERLARPDESTEAKLAAMVGTGLFVDLYPIVTNSVQIGAESYGLKAVEKLTSFQRSQGIVGGAGAVVEYDRWIAEGSKDQKILDKIASYNKDDVEATRAVRDWLVEQRPGIGWRASQLERPAATDIETDELVAELHACGPETPQHLLGDLLGYWKREDAAAFRDARRQLDAGETDLRNNVDAISSLVPVGFEDRVGDRKQLPQYAFTYPEQPLSTDIDVDSQVLFAASDNEMVSAKISENDTANRRIAFIWNKKCKEAGVVPKALVKFDSFNPGPKLKALKELAREVLRHEQESAAAQFLFNKPPRFTSSYELPTKGFEADLESIQSWSACLDRTVVPIQGPPGTGKTYVGSHVIHALIDADPPLRVGVTSMSHAAIDNLMAEVVVVADSAVAGGLKAVKTPKAGGAEPHAAREDFAYSPKISDEQLETCNVFAGTAWLFASSRFLNDPVDVLFIDEAGQVGLADMLAASMGAKSVILLGDPQQLPQVSQASHPDGSDRSALEHALRDTTSKPQDPDAPEPATHDYATMPPERGVFLDTTRRMHPDVNSFISDVIYEGRLGTHESCKIQKTSSGTGLRWIQAEHESCSTKSPIEAQLISDHISDLIGKDWTNADGDEQPLTAEDFIVVAPYNEQRRCIEDTLRRDGLAGVPVGTVDKFQGQQAAVVFFSMTASSSAEISRGIDFLFSTNRLNVAVSRARCLAYLVCTKEVLDTVARSVAEMKQIGSLCAFVDRAEKL